MPKFWFITLMDHQYVISPYLLFNGLGLVIGLLCLDTQLKKKIPSVSDKVYILFVFSIIFGWIGAYIFNWIIEEQVFVQSGFTFYGGLMGGLFFFVAASYKFGNELILPTLNVAVIPFIFAHAIGRIGCFFAGCCHGKPLTGEHLMVKHFNNHPTQLYESFFLFLLALFLRIWEKKIQKNLIFIYCGTYGMFRFFIEFLRGDHRILFYGLSSSQWISVIIVFIAMLKGIAGVRSLFQNQHRGSMFQVF